MAIRFIKERSLLLTLTYGQPSNVMNNPLNLCRAQVKLDCHSLEMNANLVEKVNPVDVTPTISCNVNQYFLVL